MAPLTWRNVDAPSFAGANDLWKTSAYLLNQAVDTARQGLRDFRNITTDEQSAALQQAVIGAGNDPAAIAAVTAKANPAYLNPQALDFANKQAGVLLDRQNQGLINTQRQQNIDVGAFDFGRKQVEAQREDANYALLPEALSQMEGIRNDLASNDPERIAAAQQRQGSFLEKYGQAAGIKSAQDVDNFIKNGFGAQQVGMQTMLNRLDYAKQIDTAALQRDGKGVASSALALAGNDPDLAIKTIQGFKNIDAETSAAAQAVVNGYRETLPKKNAADTLLQDRSVFPNATPAPAIPTTYSPGGRQRASNVDNVLTSLIDQTEGAGRYDTLYGHAQDKGPLAGVDVSRMTIGDLKQFSSRGGAYGQTQVNKLGKLATPMGRYQIVGTTMAATAKKLGLGDDVVFTPEVQDAMFNKIASDAISGPKSMAGKISALRGQWEGFKNVPDNQLASAITAYEGGQPMALTNLQRGEVTGAYGAGAAVTAQRDATLDNLISDYSNNRVDPLPSGSPSMDRINSIVSGITGGNAAPLIDTPTAPEGSVAAQVAATQIRNNQPEAPAVAGVAENLVKDDQVKTDNNNAALNAGLVKADPTAAIKINDNLTIPAVDKTAPQARQDIQIRQRNQAVSDGVAAIRSRLSSDGGGTLQGWAGNTWDYFMAAPDEAAANSARREDASQALSWFASNEAQAYFRSNPAELAKADKDPVAFGREMQAKAAAQPSRNQTQEATTANEGTSDRITRSLTAAESADQVISTAENLNALNAANDQYPALREAIRSAPSNVESPAAVASRLVNGDGAAMKPYGQDKVTAAIQRISKELGIKPSVAGALLEEKGNYTNDWFGDGDGSFKLDADQIKEMKDLYTLYQKNDNVNSGVTSLNLADMQKRQEAEIKAVRDTTEARIKTFQDQLAVETDPIKIAAYQRAIAQLEAQTRQRIENILRTGAVDSNIRTKK